MFKKMENLIIIKFYKVNKVLTEALEKRLNDHREIKKIVTMYFRSDIFTG